MRYIHYTFENGYAGCEEENVAMFDDSYTDAQITNFLEAEEYEYAEGYEYVAAGYSLNYGWENEADEEDYYENIFLSWEEITKDEYYEYIDELNLLHDNNYHALEVK